MSFSEGQGCAGCGGVLSQGSGEEADAPQAGHPAPCSRAAGGLLRDSALCFCPAGAAAAALGAHMGCLTIPGPVRAACWGRGGGAAWAAGGRLGCGTPGGNEAQELVEVHLMQGW